MDVEIYIEERQRMKISEIINESHDGNKYVTDNIKIATREAIRKNMKVVISHGGKYAVVPRDDPRSSVVPNEEYYKQVELFNQKIADATAEYNELRKRQTKQMNNQYPSPPSRELIDARKKRVALSSALEKLKDTGIKHRASDDIQESEYLGPESKVKVSKQGMQTPLNKKGFGV